MLMISLNTILVVYIGYIVVAVTVADGSSGNHRGQWKVIDPNSNIPCVAMNAQIDLKLTYLVKFTEVSKDVLVTIPKESTVSKESSCQMKNIVNNNLIDSQLLQLDLYKMPGWTVKFYFTRDSRLQTNDEKEWALYQIEVFANYSALPDLFPNSADTSHVYVNLIALGQKNEIADSLYSTVDTSFYCPSKQLYMINSDPYFGPEASITFSLLQVQSFIHSISYATSSVFGAKVVCPSDQHQADLVPIIVGSALAGFIIFTMLAYLAYRACLPAEVIQLVNANSHTNDAMSSDEEDEVPDVITSPFGKNLEKL